MNQRRPPPPRGPRPQQGPRPGPQAGPKPQHWNSYYPYYFPGYEYDYYDYYDYNWDMYDWDYLAASKAKEGTPIPPKSAEAWTDYQQGFKDGWQAAMDYVIWNSDMSGTVNAPVTPVTPPAPMPLPVMPVPMPTPMPMPVAPPAPMPPETPVE